MQATLTNVPPITNSSPADAPKLASASSTATSTAIEPPSSSKRRRTERRTERGNRRRTEPNKCNAAADVLANTYDTRYKQTKVTVATGKVPTVEVEREESDTESNIEALTKFMAAVEALDEAASSSWRARWR